MSENKFTWRQLKEAVNSVQEKFLDEEVIWWGEEKGGKIESCDKLEEKYYNDDYCYSPESTFDNLEEQVPDMDDFLDKGHPILFIKE